MDNTDLALLIVVVTMTGIVVILGAIRFYIRRRHGPHIHSYYDHHRQSVIHHRRSWRRKRFTRQQSIDGRTDKRWTGSRAVPTSTTPTQSGSSCDENDAPVEVPVPARSDDYRLSLIMAAWQETFGAEETEDSAEERDFDRADDEEMVAQFSDRTLGGTTFETVAVEITESDQPQLKFEQTAL